MGSAAAHQVQLVTPAPDPHLEVRSANEVRDVRMRVELDEPAKCVSANGMGGGNRAQTMLVLALQFTPIQHRQRILRDVWRHTMPGGALLLVEKVLGSDAEADAALVELYHTLKERNGYSREEIDRKAASLEGVLVPVTARWNEELLSAAGFNTVECVWRCLSFGAWLAVRS